MQTFTFELFVESNDSNQWRWGIRIARSKVVLEEGKANGRIAAQSFAQRAFEELVARAGHDVGIPKEYLWEEQLPR